jgi:hypothetical protein
VSATGADLPAILASPLCATFPCTTAFTPQFVGVTTIGRTIDNGDSSYLNGSKVTTTVLGGQIVSLSLYVHGPLDTAAHRSFQIGVYSSDPATGYPGTLLGVSQVGTLVGNSWNTLLIAGLPLTPLTDYWVMANNNGQAGAATNRYVYEMAAGGVGAWSVAPIPFGSWPTTFAATVTGTSFSLYVSVLP